MTDFARVFDRPPEVSATAPGRVNLIGEHTDYNGGFVLPLALPLVTRAELARRPDRTVRALSTAAVYKDGPSTYLLGEESRGGGWVDYVQAVTQVLAEDGHQVPGFDLLIDSEVPVGSGLSSSAALLVAVLRALREAASLPIDDLALALLAHRGETGLVGSPVGVMDPIACSLGDTDHALFLNTRTLEHTRVPVPADAAIALIDSGLTHHHASGGYRTRRAECEEAARLLEVPFLTDLFATDLPRVAGLPAPLDRRARHVITEHARVVAAVRALGDRELPAFGELLYASHDSMRDDFEVSLPEIDAIVALARQDPAVWGARLTGGGFGGAVLLVCHAGQAGAAAARIAAQYAETLGQQPRILLPPEP